MKSLKRDYFSTFLMYAGGSSLLLPAINSSAGNSNNNVNEKPNIVIILADDQGYADVSYHQQPSGIVTPAIDLLAKSGVVFTNGYASAYVSAPTRAGLLTGRYQQRFGFYRAADSRQGLPLKELLLPQVLKENGYKTGIFGKWHLGLEKDYTPTRRGFDSFYGFLGHGGHDYYDFNCDSVDKHTCIYRNEEAVVDKGYLTDILAREACGFIDENVKNKSPFFLYLPFNAVHFPLQAPEEDIKKFDSGDKDRDIQLAMLHRMDQAIGRVIESLIRNKVFENTLIFYFSDNGGAKVTKAINTPLRDYKHSMYEGGIRVPFIVSWPGRFSPSTCDEPVISLDIMPTICDALKIDLPANITYDGKSLLPVINRELKEPLHKTLYWDGNDGIWAIRQGDWKLIKSKSEKLELYNLKSDLSEKNDLSKQNQKMVEHLKLEFEKWRSQMADPMGFAKEKRNKKN